MAKIKKKKNTHKEPKIPQQWVNISGNPWFLFHLFWDPVEIRAGRKTVTVFNRASFTAYGDPRLRPRKHLRVSVEDNRGNKVPLIILRVHATDSKGVRWFDCVRDLK